MRKHVLGSALAIGLLAASGASAQTTATLTTLHSFNVSDGDYPQTSLISDASGALYGTTTRGGDNGFGTVFKLIPPVVSGGAWTEAVLYSFIGNGDGSLPSAALIADAAGALYGTTASGGSGYGVVFKLIPPATTGGNWSETILYAFSGSDGSTPDGLIADATGVLYGTTEVGGANGQGTLFKLAPHNPANPNNCQVTYNNSTATCNTTWDATANCSGADQTCVAYFNYRKSICLSQSNTALSVCTPTDETVLHNFTGSDGSYPYAGAAILDASGALYGTAGGGGSGYGVVYKLTNTGGNWTYAVLYGFTGGNDGASPGAGLIADASGALYGTTQNGGVYGQGTVFKLTPPSVAGGSWTESVLYSFIGNGDGAVPLSSLLFDASGALYGTTIFTSVNYNPVAAGTIFKLMPPTTTGGKWTETVLHNFSGTPDGSLPLAGLISDTSGALYGTTYNGGAGGYGTVFQLTVPAIFTGVPGKANCTGQSISFAAKKYGGIAHAAESLGYANVADFQNAVVAYCG